MPPPRSSRLNQLKKAHRMSSPVMTPAPVAEMYRQDLETALEMARSLGLQVELPPAAPKASKEE